MIDNFKKRKAMRIEHTSPLQIKDLKSGIIFEARMFNYSGGGIYFGSDGVFEKGTPLYIGIHNFPCSPKSRVFEYFKGEVMRRKELKRSLSNYGNGITLASESAEEKIYINETKKTKESRKHPRRPCSRTIQISTSKGFVKGTTKNFSASGAFIVTEEKLDPWPVVKAEFIY